LLPPPAKAVEQLNSSLVFFFYFFDSLSFNTFKFFSFRITSYDKINGSIHTSTFLYGYYGKMEDENLDIRKYISKKLDIDFD